MPLGWQMVNDARKVFEGLEGRKKPKSEDELAFASYVVSKKTILQRKKVLLAMSECKVAESFVIGGFSAKQLDALDSECHSMLEKMLPKDAFWRNKDKNVYVADLSPGVKARIRLVPKIVLSDLNWDDSGFSALLSCPYCRPFDENVRLNQLGALRGEEERLKLFAVECSYPGAIICWFYNEETDQVSTFVFNNDARPYEPICFIATVGKKRYFVMCDSYSAQEYGLMYVLQMKDDVGWRMYERTFLLPTTQLLK